MKIENRHLKSMLLEQVKRVDEACGCAGGGHFEDFEPSPMGTDLYIDDEVDDWASGDVIEDSDYELGYDAEEDLDLDPGMASDGSFLFSREQALKIVVAIATQTSCPVTRDVLLDAVSQLME